MACIFAEKCIHYNAWWCDINHNSCGVAKKALENAESAPAASVDVPDVSEKAENAVGVKEKGGRQNRKKGGV